MNPNANPWSSFSANFNAPRSNEQNGFVASFPVASPINGKVGSSGFVWSPQREHQIFDHCFLSSNTPAVNGIAQGQLERAADHPYGYRNSHPNLANCDTFAQIPYIDLNVLPRSDPYTTPPQKQSQAMADNQSKGPPALRQRKPNVNRKNSNNKSSSSSFPNLPSSEDPEALSGLSKKEFGAMYRSLMRWGQNHGWITVTKDQMKAMHKMAKDCANSVMENDKKHQEYLTLIKDLYGLLTRLETIIMDMKNGIESLEKIYGEMSKHLLENAELQVKISESIERIEEFFAAFLEPTVSTMAVDTKVSVAFLKALFGPNKYEQALLDVYNNHEFESQASRTYLRKTINKLRTERAEVASDSNVATVANDNGTDNDEKKPAPAAKKPKKKKAAASNDE